MNHLIALVCGLLFGIGLTVSQMVDPNKVLNFLDLAGTWDGSLIFVMGGGLLVFGAGFLLLVKKRSQTLLGGEISLPLKSAIDKPLISGAVMFGLGWGLTGICPGPALANLSAGNGKILAFIAAMTAGMLLADKMTAQNKDK